MPAAIWEPCCGKGAISDVLIGRGHHVISTDLVDYGYGVAGRDFLMESRAPDGVVAVVTNPPYNAAESFVAHGLPNYDFTLTRVLYIDQTGN